MIHRPVILECLPELGMLMLCIAALGFLIRINRCRLDGSQLRRLPADQVGAVQSLSFVLTVPLFILIMLFIVQLSQITIAKVVVEYAAQAAARSAQVWIPASLGPGRERENQLLGLALGGRIRDEAGVEYDQYVVHGGGGEKFEKIRFAAVMACLPICPSRNVGSQGSAASTIAAATFWKAYQAYAGAAASNPKLPVRLNNKLRYAFDSTEIELQVWHRVSDEPPVLDYAPRYDEFAAGECGWQDQIVVTVTHQFALLPGPGRILARDARAPIGSDVSSYPGTDEVGRRVQSSGRVFSYTLTASARSHNEGEKPAFEYVQRLSGSRSGTSGGPRVVTGSGPYRNRRACAECQLP